MEPAVHSDPKHDVRPDKELVIFISSADEDGKFDFTGTTTVAEAITAAVKTFGLDPNDAYDLAFPKRPDDKKPTEPLPKDRTLGSFRRSRTARS